MDIQIPTQPMPADVADAATWLHAVERHPDPEATLGQRIAISDALDELLAVNPPYPPPPTDPEPLPYAHARSHIIAALTRALDQARGVQDPLRIARALHMLSAWP